MQIPCYWKNPAQQKKLSQKDLHRTQVAILEAERILPDTNDAWQLLKHLPSSCRLPVEAHLLCKAAGPKPLMHEQLPALVDAMCACACRWEEQVTIVAADMRQWDAPEKADIIVSELLGSFGDNELSPECLDGAQAFLKEDGISIPTSYTSFLQPITTSKLWNDVKAMARSYVACAVYDTVALLRSRRMCGLMLPHM